VRETGWPDISGMATPEVITRTTLTTTTAARIGMPSHGQLCRPSTSPTASKTSPAAKMPASASSGGVTVRRESDGRGSCDSW
jgi:hypothetical protein